MLLISSDGGTGWMSDNFMLFEVHQMAALGAKLQAC